jgi:hypothetical protein
MKRIFAISAASFLALSLFACESIKTYYAAYRGPQDNHQAQNQTPVGEAHPDPKIPAARTTPVIASVPHKISTRQRVQTSTAKPVADANVPANVPTKDSLPAAAPSPAAAPELVTMSGPQGIDEQRARQQLNDASSQLSRLDRDRLQTDQLQLYQQVSGLVEAGRRALAQNDLLAASGYARKASQLATKLR